MNQRDAAPTIGDKDATAGERTPDPTATREKNAAQPGPTDSTTRERRPPASPEKRAEIMLALTQKDHPTYRAMEKLYGVRAATIHGWDQQRKDALNPPGNDSTSSVAQKTEEEYRRRTPRALPVKQRVEILREIAHGVPFKVVCDAEHADETGRKVKCGNTLRFKLPAASASERLKAVQYLDELEGVVSAKARREAEAGGNTIQPLFALPAAHCAGCSCPPGARAAAGQAYGIAAMVAPIRPSAPLPVVVGGAAADAQIIKGS